MLETAATVAQDGSEAKWLLWARGHADQLDPLENGALGKLIGPRPRRTRGRMTNEIFSTLSGAKV